MSNSLCSWLTGWGAGARGEDDVTVLLHRQAAILHTHQLFPEPYGQAQQRQGLAAYTSKSAAQLRPGGQHVLDGGEFGEDSRADHRLRV